MRSLAFIDASNLFYGGEKSLGWKIDYRKLLDYLKQKYGISTAYYFGGVDVHKFGYNYLTQDTVPLAELETYLVSQIGQYQHQLDEAQIVLLGRHLSRIRFYRKLDEFGYTLFLKPVKRYYQDDGSISRKANCDVEMAFHLMKERDQFDRVVVLSGDGDFLPVLKFLRKEKKEVIILSRGERTAREIRQFAGSSFRDFTRLESAIKFEEK